MEGRKLLEELKRTVDALQVFSEIGKTLTSTLDIKEVMRVVLQRVSELLQPTSWSLLLAEDDKITLRYEILINEPSIDRTSRVRVGQGISGWVVQANKPVFLPDPSKNKKYSPPSDIKVGEEIVSVLAVPLASKGTSLGVIELRRKGQGAQPFREEDLITLGAIADYGAIAIENARNFLKIQELTITDDLTMLYNVRHLHTLLDQEVLRSSRYKKQFSLVFLDLDKFKEVNDRHGHIYGSQLLRETASILKDKIRKTDYGARYGGDEFVVLLPETPKDKARMIAERLREAIESNSFLRELGLNIRFTASFGVATFPEDGQSKDDMIRIADERMYFVKGSTRNSVSAG